MFKSIEEWAEGTQHVTTMALRQAGSPDVVFGVFTPGRPGLGRYGFTNEGTAGTTSEHRASLEALQDVIRQANNPFQIENNGSYVATQQDLQDTQFLVFQGGGSPVSVYDGMVPSAPPSTGTVPGPGPVVPAPFDTGHVPDLDAKLNALAEKIISKLDSLKGGGDDKAKLALQHLSLKAAEIQALSAPKHQRFDDLVAAISAAVAEGGA